MEMTKNSKEEAKNSTQEAPKNLTESVSKQEEKKKALSQNLKYMRDKDRELVKGIFRFHEVPGGCLNFSFKAYKQDEVERYDMVDGQVYTVPLGVAKHLNKNLWYPEYAYVKSEGVYNGFGPNQTMKATKKVRRCSFQSLEFIDVDEVPTNVQSVVLMEAM